MALLTSGSSATFTGSSTSASVAVTAGAGNRKLIVGFAMESNVSVDALTFNGSDIVALGLDIDLTDISNDSVSHCIMFEQFEAGLPASGSHTLAATFSGSATGGGRMFYWLVDGVEQGELAVGASGGVNNGGTSGATFQTDETFAAGDDDRVICAVAYRNDNATSLLLTTPSSATNVADVTITGGGRVSGSAKVGSMGTGTVRPTWTTQATGASRRTGAACVLNPAAGGAAHTIGTAAFASGPSSSAATVSRGRDASVASFVSGASSSAAQLSRGRSLTAAFASGVATAAATVEVARSVAVAAFQAGAAAFSATAEVSGNKTLTAAFQAGAAAFSAAVTRGREIGSAGFQAGAAAFSATASVGAPAKAVHAAFESGPASMSATVALSGRNLSWTPAKRGRTTPSGRW